MPRGTVVYTQQVHSSSSHQRKSSQNRKRASTDSQTNRSEHATSYTPPSQAFNPCLSNRERHLQRSNHSTGNRTICTVSPTESATTARTAGPSKDGRLEAPDSGFHAGKKNSTAANKAKLVTLSRQGDGGATAPAFETPPAPTSTMRVAWIERATPAAAAAAGCSGGGDSAPLAAAPASELAFSTTERRWDIFCACQ